MINLIGKQELMELLDIKTATLSLWMAKGVLPTHAHIGKKVFWKREEINAWIEERFNQASGK